MKKSLISLLAISTFPHTGEFDGPIVDDPKVLDCIMNMYFYLLLEENDPKKEEYYQKFEQQFDALPEKQKAIVKEDFLGMINAKEEQETKEFIKRQNEKSE